jgi:hypothetical protein
LRGLLTIVRSQELMAEVHRLDVEELLQDAARLTAPRKGDAPQAERHPIHLSVDRPRPLQPRIFDPFFTTKPYRLAALRQVADDVAAATASE